jgi:hypothetical protein
MSGLRRHWRLALVVGCFPVTTGLLIAIRKPERLAVPRGAAIAAASHGHLRHLLDGMRWLAQVTALDVHTVLVSFQVSGRLEAQALVSAPHHVAQALDFASFKVPYGDWIAYQPAALIGVSLVFVLVSAVAPLKRLRNLDVAVMIALICSVVLFARRYIDESLSVAFIALCYLMVRCAVVGLRQGPLPAASTPLLTVLAPRWTQQQRLRILRLLLVALGAVYLMVTISSPDAVDVTYAVMEGATKILHGMLPYGHLTGEVFHGDTYPIFSYLLYTPLAALDPVTSIFSSVDDALALTALAGLSVAFAVGRGVMLASRRASGHAASPEAEEAGLRAAIAWLAFPSILITTSTGTTDVVLAAMLAYALMLWRRPVAASSLLGLAGWFKLVPFALVPLWLAPLRGRRLAAAIAALVLTSAAMIAALVALGGWGGPGAMLHAVRYQFERGQNQALPAALGLQFAQPLIQGATLTLLVAGSLAVGTDQALARDLRRIAALASTILIGLELSANYWAFLYIAWFAPLLTSSLLSDPRSALPRSSARRGPPAQAEPGGSCRIGSSGQPAAWLPRGALSPL